MVGLESEISKSPCNPLKSLGPLHQELVCNKKKYISFYEKYHVYIYIFNEVTNIK